MYVEKFSQQLDIPKIAKESFLWFCITLSRLAYFGQFFFPHIFLENSSLPFPFLYPILWYTTLHWVSSLFPPQPLSPLSFPDLTTTIIKSSQDPITRSFQISLHISSFLLSNPYKDHNQTKSDFPYKFCSGHSCRSNFLHRSPMTITYMV